MFAVGYKRPLLVGLLRCTTLSDIYQASDLLIHKQSQVSLQIMVQVRIARRKV
jgi:hypothetical protein